MKVVIHHLAAVSSDLARTIRFYCQVLGLKYIKKAMPFDGPQVGHFYWDENIEQFLTFYHCPGLLPNKIGETLGAVSFAVNPNAIHYWERRLRYYSIAFRLLYDEKEDCPFFVFHDPDGLYVNLVFTPVALLKTTSRDTRTNHGINGFHGVQIHTVPDSTVKQLFTQQLEMDVSHCAFNHLRFFRKGKKDAGLIDVKTGKISKANGYGRIHHVALKINNSKRLENLYRFIQRYSSKKVCKKHKGKFISFDFHDEAGVIFEFISENSLNNSYNEWDGTHNAYPRSNNTITLPSLH